MSVHKVRLESGEVLASASRCRYVVFGVYEGGEVRILRRSDSLDVLRVFNRRRGHYSGERKIIVDFVAGEVVR